MGNLVLYSVLRVCFLRGFPKECTVERRIIDANPRVTLDETMQILHQKFDKLKVQCGEQKSSIVLAAKVNASNFSKPKLRILSR